MEIERVAKLLQHSQRIVALTGAGISTPSGIPDFRSVAGEWTRVNPLEVASLGSFLADPRPFYRWIKPLVARIQYALPNPAHAALALLERSGKLCAVITQNIDGLHQRAGSREVIELHGHLRSSTCTGCGRQTPTEPLLQRLRADAVPRCSCRAAFKPDVVLFGEELPRTLYWMARQLVQQCDLLLVVGSSLEVAPANELPELALCNGARIVVFNRDETHIDTHAEAILRGDVAETLPSVLSRMNFERSVGHSSR